ncbi:hypothetical protein L7F22_028271 [Adiantum nelumboides]|nr:hypothetical protein [Adiantum nelumboides]
MGDKIFFKLALWWGFAVAPCLWWMWRGNPVPYGRHHSGAHAIQGTPSLPYVHLVLPTRVAWFLMECPPLLFLPPIFALGRYASFPVPRLLALIFLIHYGHRSLVYPLRMRPSETRNFPIIVLLSGFLFNMYNTYIQARSLSHFTFYAPTWFSSSKFVLGSFLFVSGMMINIWADSVLMSLRKPASRKSATLMNSQDNALKSYVIPRGGLFELVTCPNYFGEILEWLGWAIATWSFAGLVFLALTVCNLSPRALAHHRWYIRNFANYPTKRRALIPFCF